VFFVIKIQQIQKLDWSLGRSRLAGHITAPASHHPVEPGANLSPDLALGPARIFTDNVSVQARSGGPIIESFFFKVRSFLRGYGSRVESDVNYRKQRDTYQSTRGYNSPLSTIELTDMLASYKITNRASCESALRQNRPMESSAPFTIPVPENRYV
jgi:hypothetical protein